MISARKKKCCCIRLQLKTTLLDAFEIIEDVYDVRAGDARENL